VDNGNPAHVVGGSGSMMRGHDEDDLRMAVIRVYPHGGKCILFTFAMMNDDNFNTLLLLPGLQSL